MKPDTETQAFEVEDVSTRQNFTFRYNADAQTVDMINTSIGQEPMIMASFPRDTVVTESSLFPFKQETAYAYYQHMHDKACHVIDNPHPIHFLGFVDPESYTPLEEGEENNEL